MGNCNFVNTPKSQWQMNGKFRNLTMPVLKCQLLCAVPEIGQIDHNYFLIPNNRLFFRKIFQISNAVIPYWADRKYLPFSAKICFILWAFSISIFPSAQISFFCTSQQKVDTFFIFYTLKTEHSTPYIVLVSNSLMSMQVFLH